jgi:hypothetical protein
MYSAWLPRISNKAEPDSPISITLQGLLLADCMIIMRSLPSPSPRALQSPYLRRVQAGKYCAEA